MGLARPKVWPDAQFASENSKAIKPIAVDTVATSQERFTG